MTIFLDLDGPVLDTSERDYLLYRAIVTELGGSTAYHLQVYWELKRSGLSSTEIVRGDKGAANVQAGRLSELWLSQIESPNWLNFDRLQQGAADWLEQMANRFTLALATLRQSRSQLDEQLEHLGLNNLFRVVLSDSPTLGTGWETKRRLIANSGLPLEGVMIGDSEVDVRAGKLAGLGTIAVSCGIRSRQFLAAEQPDLLVNSLAEVKAETIFSVVKRDSKIVSL